MNGVRRDKDGNLAPWKCPQCGHYTNKFAALSRKDNKTMICPDCGINEAMFDFMRSINKKR